MTDTEQEIVILPYRAFCVGSIQAAMPGLGPDTEQVIVVLPYGAFCVVSVKICTYGANYTNDKCQNDLQKSYFERLV